MNYFLKTFIYIYIYIYIYKVINLKKLKDHMHQGLGTPRLVSQGCMPSF